MWRRISNLLFPPKCVLCKKLLTKEETDLCHHCREHAPVFTKEKIKMRAGETDKAVSFKDQKLFDLIEKFSEECGWLGQIDVDVFDVDGEYYISEVNPRFGGGYPHAYECGCDHIQLIVNNLEGKVNDKNIGQYVDDILMMKYNEIAIRHKDKCVSEIL